jgi:hypothetical protein
MLARPRNFKKKAAIHAALILIQVCGELSAQNFTARSAGLNPFGANGPLPFGRTMDSLGGAGIKGGLSTGIAFDSVYDSNFFQSADDEESEVTLSLTPSIVYISDPEGGARISISAAYLPSANAYLNNSDFNTVDQSGSFSMIVSGSRTTISAYARYSQDSGADRLAGGFVTGSSLSIGLQGNYQLAPRTSVFAGWSSSLIDYSNGEEGTGGSGGGDSAVGFNDHSFSVGGFWSATERFSFGPSFSYATNTSDNTGSRDSWGCSLQANYKAAEKIQLGGSLGFQYSENSREQDSGDFNLTGSLNASYQINELWSWGSSIQSGVVPSPATTNYVINNWLVASSLNRALLIGSAGVGVDLQFSSFDTVGPTGVSQSDENNFGVFMSYQRPLFEDRIGFSSSLRYSFNDAKDDWSQIQLNIGLSIQF